MAAVRFSSALGLASLLILASSCATPGLSPSERSRLDPILQRVVVGDTSSVRLSDVTTNADGARVYGVIVRTADASVLRAQGFSVASVFGEVVVVHATIPDILRLARLDSVRSISVGSENQLH